MNNMSYIKRVDWAIDLLNLLRRDAGGSAKDYPPTPGTISFILHWMGRENTKARNNPLATTWNMGNSDSFNDHNVRNYRNRQEGLEATVRTLTKTNPKIAKYDNLRVLLRQGTTPDQVANNAGARKELGLWGTWAESPGTWGSANTNRINSVIESDLENAVIIGNEGAPVVEDVPNNRRLPGEMADREVNLGPDDLQLLSDNESINAAGGYSPNDPRRNREPNDPNEDGRMQQPPPESTNPTDPGIWSDIETPSPNTSVDEGDISGGNYADAFYGFLKGDPRGNIVIGGIPYNIIDYLDDQVKRWDAEEGMTAQEKASRVSQFITKWMPTTEWWKSTAPQMRDASQTWYQQGLGEDWETLTPARRALIEDKRREIEGYIQNAGATYTSAQLDDVAITAYMFNFDEAETRRYLSGQTVYGQTYADVLTEGEAAAGSEIREILQDIRSLGNEYLIKLPQTGEKELARRIFTGDLPKENLRTIMQEKARMLYGDKMSDYFDAGGTTEEFLGTYDPVVSKLLGRRAQWNGTDYSLGQAILSGDRSALRPWAEQQTELAGTNVSNPALQRPFTVREAELAVRMSPEFDSSGFAIAEMSNILNTVGAGMGAI